MDSMNLKKIKRHNILNLERFIFNQESVSRSELAELSGLSLMTVGKIVELLKAAGIVYEQKEDHSSVGRKANRVFVNNETKTILIIDVSKYDFEFICMSLSGTEIAGAYSCIYDKDKAYAQNLELALNNFLRCNLKTEKIIGITVLTPGPYYAVRDAVINRRIPEITEISIKKLIRKYFENPVIVINEDVRFAAHYAVRSIDGYEHKNIFYAYIGEGVGGAAVNRGKALDSAFNYSCDFGQIWIDNRKTAEEYLTTLNLKKLFSEEELTDPDFYAKNIKNPQLIVLIDTVKEVLIHCFRSVMWLLDPDEIMIDSEYLQLIPDFYERINRDFQAIAKEERGSYIPRLIQSKSYKKAQFIGARDYVRGCFLSTLAGEEEPGG